MLKKLLKIGFIVFLFTLTPLPIVIVLVGLMFYKDGAYIQGLLQEITYLWNEMLVRYDISFASFLPDKNIMILAGVLVTAAGLLFLLYKISRSLRKFERDNESV